MSSSLLKGYHLWILLWQHNKAVEVVAMHLRPGDLVPSLRVLLPLRVDPGGLVEAGGHQVPAALPLPVEVLDAVKVASTDHTRLPANLF